LTDRSLVVRFIGDTKNLQKSVDEVGDKVNGFTKMLTGVAAVGGALGGIEFFKKAIEDAEKAEKVTRQTNAVLESTGGIAKVTGEQVESLAKSMALKSGVDKQTITSGENVLLTFTKVRNEAGKGNDVFNQGSQAALDMSAALGKDLQGSVIQVGKALNDPIKGITALQKAGVSFTAQQKDEIKALVAKGDTLSAQKVILKELNTEFGGMAGASATSSAKMHVAFQELSEGIGKMLLPAFDAAVTWITISLLPAVERLAHTVEKVLSPKVSFAAGIFKKDLVPVLQDAYQWLEKNRIVIVGLETAAASFAALITGIKGVSLAMQAWKIIMSGNIVVIIIVALIALAVMLVYAYNHCQKFREICQAAFKAVQEACSIAWNSYIKPALAALILAFQWVGDKANWLWINVLKPVFTIIGQYVGLVWNDYLKPVLTTLMQILVKVGTILFSVWNTVLKPTFTAIGVIVSTMWTYFIRPIFGLIFVLLGVFGALLLSIWKTIVFPILTLIGGIFKWLWQTAIGPALNGIMNIITFLWMNVFKPAFQGIGAVIKWVWDNVIKPAFEALKSGIDRVKDSFQSGSSAIEKIWNGLKAIAVAPINFIIETVFNDGILRVWNWLADKIDPSLHVNPIKPIKLASGGPINGPGGPTDDKILAALSNGEYVVKASAYAQNRALVEAINAGQVFAQGGTVGYGVNSNSGQNRSDPGGGGTTTANDTNWSKAVNGFLNDPLGTLAGLFGKVFDGVQKFEGTVLGKTIIEIPRKILTNVVKFLKDKVTGIFSGGGGGGSGGGGGIGGTAQWTALVTEVLTMLGQSLSLVPNVLRRMNQESGGNPNAINRTDINAQQGHPSQGLMQTIPSTFASYAGPFVGAGILNPLANIYAGVNYAIHRYPSLQYAMDKPGGYVNGGILKPGQFGFNETSEPEAILNKQQWNAITNNKGGNTYVLNVYEAANSTIDLRAQFARMQLMDAP
jgi:hypothetical protein